MQSSLSASKRSFQSVCPPKQRAYVSTSGEALLRVTFLCFLLLVIAKERGMVSCQKNSDLNNLVSQLQDIRRMFRSVNKLHRIKKLIMHHTHKVLLWNATSDKCFAMPEPDGMNGPEKQDLVKAD